jgi:hypothetical protein
MKRCPACKQELPEESFSWQWRAKGIRRSRCKTCYNKYQSNYRKEHLANTRKHVSNHRKRKREYIRKVKEGAVCADCKKKYPPYVYDFDHRDPKKKKFDIAAMVSHGFGLKKIKKEIEKCDIVCANCHRIRTYTLCGASGDAGLVS